MRSQLYSICALLVSIACVSAGTRCLAQSQPVTNSAPSPDPGAVLDAPNGSATNNTSAASPDFVIGPSDVLNINVWRESEISRSVPVRPDGKISLPLLGDLQASGLTADQLHNVIKKGLKDYISNPEVT